jgi:carboxypeptidase PM20D1
MIRCETISSRDDPSREKFYAMHKVLERLFPRIHDVCEIHNFDGSLLFKWPGAGRSQPILLMSHQDVVEAAGAWTHPPFSGEIADGKVWGRGTIDTKGNLFCIMQAVEELIGEGYAPACDVYIASSCTEEISGDGAPATAAWLKENGVRLRLLLDEGGMILEKPIGGLKGVYGMVGVLEKGYGDLKFTSRSGGGHASAPGKNTPLVQLGKFMVDVDKKSPFQAKLNPTVEEMFRRFAPNMDFLMKLVMANLWLFRPILPRMLSKVSPQAGAMVQTTIAFTTAKGSGGLNVLPQEAYVTGNLRFSHHQDRESSIRIISGKAGAYGLETEVMYAHSACPVADYHSDAFQLVTQVMGEVYPGVGVSPYVMTGGTDARSYSGVCDNVLRFAPLYIDSQQLASVHGLDENINVASLGLGVDFFRRIIQKA